jgi:hypothetical protein
MYACFCLTVARAGHRQRGIIASVDGIVMRTVVPKIARAIHYSSFAQVPRSGSVQDGNQAASERRTVTLSLGPIRNGLTRQCVRARSEDGEPSSGTPAGSELHEKYLTEQRNVRLSAIRKRRAIAMKHTTMSTNSSSNMLSTQKQNVVACGKRKGWAICAGYFTCAEGIESRVRKTVRRAALRRTAN